MDASQGVECWLDSAGRLRDAKKNDYVFTDQTFDDAIAADYWLHFCDDFARFVKAYLT